MICRVLSSRCTRFMACWTKVIIITYQALVSSPTKIALNKNWTLILISFHWNVLTFILLKIKIVFNTLIHLPLNRSRSSHLHDVTWWLWRCKEKNLIFKTPTKSIWFVHFCSVNLLELSVIYHLFDWWVLQVTENKIIIISQF